MSTFRDLLWALHGGNSFGAWVARFIGLKGFTGFTGFIGLGFLGIMDIYIYMVFTWFIGFIGFRVRPLTSTLSCAFAVLAMRS